MSEHIWARVGQLLAAIAAIGGIIPLYIWLSGPSSRLVAEIRPIAFRLPVTAQEISGFMPQDQGGRNAQTSMGQISRATSLVKIDLHNLGDLPISGIHVDVVDAVLYAKGTEGADDSSVVPSDHSGITLDNLMQGNSVTLYVWTLTAPPVYQHWDYLYEKFRVSYAQGVATKKIYIENTLTEGWIERNGVGTFALSVVFLMFLMMVMSVRRERRRKQEDESPTEPMPSS